MIDTLNAEELTERLETLEVAWANLDARARELEELDKPLLAQIALAYRTLSRSHSEAIERARASNEYHNHVVGMVEARRLANISRAALIRHKTYIEILRTNSANSRAMVNLR